MKSIDMRDRRGPMVSVQLAEELRGLAAGEMVEVVTDRQSVADYLIAWCRDREHRLVSIDSIAGDLRVVIRKAQLVQRERPSTGHTLSITILG